MRGSLGFVGVLGLLAVGYWLLGYFGLFGRLAFGYWLLAVGYMAIGYWLLAYWRFGVWAVLAFGYLAIGFIGLLAFWRLALWAIGLLAIGLIGLNWLLAIGYWLIGYLAIAKLGRLGVWAFLAVGCGCWPGWLGLAVGCWLLAVGLLAVGVWRGIMEGVFESTTAHPGRGCPLLVRCFDFKRAIADRLDRPPYVKAKKPKANLPFPTLLRDLPADLISMISPVIWLDRCSVVRSSRLFDHGRPHFSVAPFNSHDHASNPALGTPLTRKPH